MEKSEGLAKEVLVLRFLSGIVTKLEGVDFCMDGASHLLHTITVMGPQTVRLATADPTVKKELDRVAGTRKRVTVAGHFVYGPECHHFKVYYLKLTDDLAAEIGLKISE
jgi:hypothetical protein